MEFLRKLVVQTQSHLKGLTLSQRMAIGMCVILIAVALLLVMKWAAEPQRVPLLDQAMSADDVTRIRQRLDAQGVDYELTGDTIMVPAGERFRLLAQLGQQRALPQDISAAFSKFLGENSSPWLSTAEQERRWNVAMGSALSMVLARFDGVQDAQVFVDKTTRRMVGQPSITPTASVSLRLSEGTDMERGLVRAVASFISGAVAGLDVHNVTVVDSATGRSASVPRPEDGFAYDDLDDRRKKEEYFANEIKGLLAHIPGLMVRVHAELDPESRRETKQIHGKPAMTQERTESEKQSRAVAAGEPGVRPNTEVAVAAGGPGETREKKTNDTQFDAKVDTTVTTTETPRHGIKSLSAAVAVPRSYLASIYSSENNGKEPADTDLSADPRTKEEMDKIRRMALRGLGETDAEKVEVNWFRDGVTVAAAGVTHAGMGGDVMELVGRYWDKAGLAALAFVGLLMMLMMVRKVGDGPILPGEEPPDPKIVRIRSERRAVLSEPIDMVEPPVGEARETEELLVGKEVDESTVRTQQVVEQVQSLVKDDPRMAASILQQWADSGSA